MRSQVMSVLVDDQARALAFYTEVLGFVMTRDEPAGEFRVLTVQSPEGGPELLLEPNAHPASQVYQEAIYRDGLPSTVFHVDDLDREYARLTALGVRFQVEPTRSEWGYDAVLDDTCGNLIALHED